MKRNALLLLCLGILFAGWGLWLARGRVTLYAVSEHARLEVEQPPVPVQTPVDGVVVACDVALGRKVQPGDVLVRLDARVHELQVAQLDKTIEADLVGVEALTALIQSEEKARNAVADMAGKTAAAGQAKIAATETSTTYKDQENKTLARLGQEQLASKLDVMRAQGEADSIRASVSAAKAQLALDRSGSYVSLRDRDVRIVSLKKDLATARAIVEEHRAQKKSAEFEIERRTVRAMVAGTLGDTVPCAVGMTVTPTQSLATILPTGTLRVVAFFRAETSAARMRPSQHAVLRMDAFPWTQYGTVDAVVEHVGTEPRDGLLRVELRVTKPNPAIALSHGLTCGTEVEVERISPLQLLLRMAGQWTGPPSRPAPSPSAGLQAGP